MSAKEAWYGGGKEHLQKRNMKSGSDVYVTPLLRQSIDNQFSVFY